MRCENCGREMDNAQLWQLGADPKAPSAWSMRVLCWDCREHPQGSAARTSERPRPITTAPDTGSELPKAKAS